MIRDEADQVIFGDPSTFSSVFLDGDCRRVVCLTAIPGADATESQIEARLLKYLDACVFDWHLGVQRDLQHQIRGAREDSDR